MENHSDYMGHIKQENISLHMQNVWTHRILHMLEMSSKHLLSTEKFCCIKWFYLRTAKALIRLGGYTSWSELSLYAYTPKTPFGFVQLIHLLFVWPVNYIAIRFLLCLCSFHILYSSYAGLWNYHTRLVELVPFPWGQVRNINLLVLG